MKRLQKPLILAGLAIAMFAAPSAQAQTIPIPAEIAARKKITVALFAAFPPMAYKKPETGELIGIDVDLMAYLGRKLGVAIEWQEVSYESAVNSLVTGRVDMALSMFDSPEAADKLDFLPYLTSGLQPYTLATHAPIPDWLSMCGLKIGANRRNAIDAAMRKWSDANCLPAGKPPLDVQEADGTPAARLALRQGRVDVAIQSAESVPYTMSQDPGLFVKIGKALTSQMIVASFPKRSAELRQAVTLALKAAVDDGSYAAALAKHGLQDNSAADVLKAR